MTCCDHSEFIAKKQNLISLGVNISSVYLGCDND